jgi:hypothetical protein
METKGVRDREHEAAKAFVLLVPVFVLSGLAVPQVVPPSDSQDQENFRISVEVDLVVLQARVTDRAGHPVPELNRQDFQVFEDGRPQPIRLFRHEDTPVTVGLVIDHSGSMRAKLGDVITGARAFVHSSNPNDQMFVVNFNETVSLGLPAGMHFSDSAEKLGVAIWGAPAIGATVLYDAIIEALTCLRQKGSDCYQRWRRQCEQSAPGPSAEDGGTIECHDLHDWYFRPG